MLCPRCNKHTLEEREKDGVTIDVCQECRGIWLDRGELERLIARVTTEMDKQVGTYARSREYQADNEYHDKHRGHYEDQHKHHSHDEHHGHHGYGDTHHRKRHWLAEFFD